MSEIKKIGMYSTDEILEFMTEGEGRSFLGRSMFDAIYFEIERLNNIINELEKMMKNDLECACLMNENGLFNGAIDILEVYLDKLQDLKGSVKE